MRIKRHDHRLNLFDHFGGPATNENNTTRAFVAALSHSPAGALLLRKFLDHLCDMIPRGKQCDESLRDCFQSFLAPEKVDLGLQIGVTDDFPHRMSGGMVVELAPCIRHAETGQDENEEPAGIADGYMKLSLPADVEGDDAQEFLILLESKLYDSAPEEQLRRYRAAFGSLPSGIVTVEWEQVYALCSSLDSFANSDPVIMDFMEFLARRPTLVPFVGFMSTDIGNYWAIDQRINQLGTQFQEMALGNMEQTFTVSQWDRKKGGADYDLKIKTSNGVEVPGNLGLASWDGEEISTKLVTGARSRSEIDWITWGQAEAAPVAQALKAVSARKGAQLNLIARVYFNRFEEGWVPVRTYDLIGNEAERTVSDVREYVDTFHGAMYDDESSNLLIAKWMGKRSEKNFQTNWKQYVREKQAAGKTAKVFAAITVTIPHQIKELEKKSAESQKQEMKDDLDLLTDLLYALYYSD